MEGLLGDVAFGFQSTHPVWGGTIDPCSSPPAAFISIHPPRVGWDRWRRWGLCAPRYFNPPTPCGVGRHRVQKLSPPLIFQSTHPVWGGTWSSGGGQLHRPISIHPPRVGWDYALQGGIVFPVNFNPPTPCGVGPVPGWHISQSRSHFNPPTPCGVGPGYSTT